MCRVCSSDMDAHSAAVISITLALAPRRLNETCRDAMNYEPTTRWQRNRNWVVGMAIVEASKQATVDPLTIAGALSQAKPHRRDGSLKSSPPVYAECSEPVPLPCLSTTGVQTGLFGPLTNSTTMICFSILFL